MRDRTVCWAIVWLPHRLISLAKCSRFALRGAVVSLTMLLSTATARAEVSPEQYRAIQFSHQLSQSQLYRLAEIFCQRQIEQFEGDATSQARWATRLIDTMVERAIDASEPPTMTDWREIVAIADQYRARFGETLEGCQIELRRQRVQLAQADGLLANSRLTSTNGSERRRQAIDLLRRTSSSLEKLGDQITEYQVRPSTNRDAAVASAFQRLAQEVRYTSGRVALMHAECYSTRSPDQVHLLTEAQREFSALARITPPTQLAWESRLHEIEVQRRLNNLQEAEQRLRQFPLDQAPDSVRLAFRIERARIDVARGRTEVAAERLANLHNQIPRDADVNLRAELMLTQVDTFMNLARQKSASGETDQSREYQQTAIGLIQKMEQNVPRHWVRRAEGLLSIDQLEAGDASDLEVIRRTADNLYRQGRFDDARTTYAQAADLAQKLQRPDESMAFGLKAAAIFRQQDDFVSAVNAFRELAALDTSPDQAAKAHWLAITSAVDQARRDPEYVFTYESLLDEHLSRWPDSPRAPNARVLLGRLKRAQGNLPAAIDVWRETRFNSPFAESTLPELREAYHARIEQLAGSPDQQRSLAVDAATRYADWRDAAGQATSLLAQDVAVTAAEFSLMYELSSVEYALSLLDSRHHTGVTSGQLTSRIEAIYGLAKALDGQSNEAIRHWDHVDWQQYSLVPLLVQRLAEAIDSSPESDSPSRPGVVQAVLALTPQLKRTKRWKDRREVVNCEAVALAQRGQLARALELLEQLVQAHPHDTELRRRLATLYQSSSRAPDHQRAVDHWRRLVRLAKPESVHWYRAKLGIVRGLIELDQRQRAIEIVDLLMALHPDMGDPKLRDEFTQLRLQAGGR